MRLLINRGETDTLSENRESMRAYAHQYRTEADALSFDRANSIQQSLDGEWRFYWSRVPEESPESFYAPSFDVSGWETIEVPSNWQLEKRDQGYDFPMYRNSGYYEFDHSTFPKIERRTGTQRPAVGVLLRWIQR